MRGPRRGLPGARHPARGRPDPLAVPDLPRVRFSKDKSPYKTNVAASFPWAEGGGADGPHGFGESGNPGGYFHLSPGEVYIGGGMWHPPTAKLAAFRGAVADDPKRVRGLLDDPKFMETFGEISGDKLTRVPPGFPKDHPEAELLKQKDLTFGRRLADDDVFSPGLPDLIAESLRGRRSGHALARRALGASQPRRNRSDPGSDGTIRTTLTAPDRGRPHPGRRSPEGSAR